MVFPATTKAQRPIGYDIQDWSTLLSIKTAGLHNPCREDNSPSLEDRVDFCEQNRILGKCSPHDHAQIGEQTVHQCG